MHTLKKNKHCYEKVLTNPENKNTPSKNPGNYG